MKNTISDEAVSKATGNDWNGWFNTLDNAGAEKWTHQEIVKYLTRKHGVRPWWRQGITSAYENKIGRRETGETMDAGFEIGVRKTLWVTPLNAWEWITTPRGMKVWLGYHKKLSWSAGETYKTTDGASGEVRAVKSKQRIRVSWKPADWKKTTTIQVWIIPAGKERTTIAFHQENLPSLAARSQMKEKWETVLNRMAQELKNS